MDSFEVILNEELYSEIVYRTPTPRFHTFEAEFENVGLYFADQVPISRQ